MQTRKKILNQLLQSRMAKVGDNSIDCITVDKLSLWANNNSINDATLKQLLELAKVSGISQQLNSMFAGGIANKTENRKALHMAFRNSGNNLVTDTQATKDAAECLAQQKKLSEDFTSGKFCSRSGKPFKYIVNIGIGGSFLGSQFVSTALKDYHQNGIKVFFFGKPR